MVDTDAALVIRPARRRFLGSIWAGALVAAYDLATTVASVAFSLPPGLVVPLLACVPVAYLLLLHYLLTARLEVGPDRVVLRGFLGRRRAVARHDLAGVALRDVTGLGVDEPLRYLLLHGRDWRVRLRLYRELWAEEDLQALVRHLGLEHRTTHRRLGHRELGRELPGAEAWPLRHPLLTALLLGVAILAGLLAALVDLSAD
jgi:hypothetical protein